MSAARAGAAYAPYPEIVEALAHERPYLVSDTTGRDLPSPGMVDKRERHILVPLDVRGRHVARHELAHVRWSPRSLPRVDVPRFVLMAVEDARVNLGLAAVGVPVTMGARERASVSGIAAADVARGERGLFVLRAVAALGTDGVEAVLAPAQEEPELLLLARRSVDRAARVLVGDAACRGKPVARFATGLRVARELWRELRALGLEHGLPQEPPPGCLHGPPADADEPDPLGGALGGLPSPRGSLGRAGADGGRPGRMAVTSARLPLRCRRARGGDAAGWRPGVEGSVVRWPHRFPVDRAVFRRRTRARGGSVLIDTSGSMALSSRDLDRVLDATPWATLVALYSGRGEEGELRVVARDGRRARADALAPFGGGNVVDLPALQWLARQPSPRVWISDGRVTGVGDRGHPEITRRCRELCARARIARVRDAEGAARVLRGRDRPGKSEESDS